MPDRLTGATLALALAWGAGGCGYHVVSGAAPFGAHTLAVVPFAEQQPLGLAPEMAAHLGRLLAAGGVHLALDEAEADAVLTGTIVATHAPSTTLKTVQIYTVGTLVHAELRDAHGARLWAGDVTLREDFLPTDPIQDIQPLVSETNRRTALRRLAERAAVAVHEALVVASAVQERS
jgi:hypothetical protein